MAKVKIPKKIAGYKVPKSVRSNSILKALLGSKVGRDVLAKALLAGAGAAAAILVEEKEEVADTIHSGKRKGTKALGIVGRAINHGSHAALDVVRDAATSALPKKYREGNDKNPRKGVAVH
jgi:hypothetical protein